MKKYYYSLFSLLFLASCSSDFLDTTPNDALSPSTFWKTEKDAKLALTGCYSGFADGFTLMYRDCGSDNAYNNFPWEGWTAIGNGTLSAADPGNSYFNYTTIDRCNEFLQNIGNVGLDEQTTAVYAAQARFIRAFKYFELTTNYGAVPLVTTTLANPEAAKLPRNSAEEVGAFIISELKAIINILPTEYPGAEYGKATKGAAQALLMRFYLYKGQYQDALTTAKSITGYSLYSSYKDLFNAENEQNSEVILAAQYIPDLYSNDLTPFLPNGSGGWSSVVPTQSLVDSYEMADGKTIAEAETAGEYDPQNPYVNRDPRLRATVIYPGQMWQGKPFRSCEAGDDNYYKKADNASKSGYNFRKYIGAYDANPDGDYWNSGGDVYVFRYAEVLLTIAEAKNELGQIDNELYDVIDQVRQRAGMPKTNRSKYNTKETLRALIRNERRVEFAMEGLRRDDIIRWGIASQVMNGDINTCKLGTVLDTKQPNGDFNVSLTLAPVKIETREFTAPKNNLLPIPQSAIDKNPKLVPNNSGY